MLIGAVQSVAVERTGEGMTVQTLKLGRERFVLLREKDYRELKDKARPARAPSKTRRLTAQDRRDLPEANRRDDHASSRPDNTVDALAKLNAEMNADAARVKRLAKANCRRLTGKSHL